jgi:hypothetical protein
MFDKLEPWGPGTTPPWAGRSRPIAAPLDQCAELLGVDLATIQEVAASVEPCIRGDGSKV